MDDKTNIPSESEVLAFFAYAKGRLQAEFPTANYIDFTACTQRDIFVASLTFDFDPFREFRAEVDSLEQAIVQLRVQIPTNQIRAIELRVRAWAMLDEANKISS